MMNAGLIANLAVTAGVQAIVGGIIATIIRRYVAAVDRLADRVKELEEKRIADLEASVAANDVAHTTMSEKIAERIGREEQSRLIDRIEAVADQQSGTMIEQTKTATQMTMAANQISELFGRIARLSTDVAKMQGKMGD